MPAKKKATTAVAKKADRTVAAVSQFKTGFEMVESDLIQIPRLKIVQKTSAEFDEGIPFLSLVNSVTKDVICKGKKDGASAVIIPFSFARTRLLFSSPKEGNQLLCRSNDGINGVGNPGGVCSDCIKSRWGEWKLVDVVDKKTKKKFKDWRQVPGTDDVPPECSEALNYFCIVRDHEFPLPLAVSFMKTSYGEGRKFYNMLIARRQQGINPASYSFTISTIPETNEAGTYGVYKITPEGKSTDEEFNQALQYIEFLSKRKAEVDYDDVRSAPVDEAFED